MDRVPRWVHSGTPWGDSPGPTGPAPQGWGWDPDLSADSHCVQRVLGVARVTGVDWVMAVARVMGRARVVVRPGSYWGKGCPRVRGCEGN